MTVTFTVCGSAGTHPGPGRACSGYLVRDATTCVMLDCGNGSLTNALQVVDLAAIDAVVLSHLHADHCVDLYGLYYGRRFHPDGARPVDVYAPAGAADHLSQLMPSGDTVGFTDLVRFHEVAAGDELRVDAMSLRFFAAAHPIETLATRVEVEGRALAFSGDTHLADGVVEAARDAELFVCDATWLERHRPLPKGIHCTGAEAGDMADRAGAQRLLVTHVVPTNDPDEVAAEARGRTAAEVVAATDRLELVV